MSSGLKDSEAVIGLGAKKEDANPLPRLSDDKEVGKPALQGRCCGMMQGTDWVESSVYVSRLTRCGNMKEVEGGNLSVSKLVLYVFFFGSS